MDAVLLWVHALITSPPESAVLGQDLNALFYLAWSISTTLWVLNLPNYDRDLDAHKFEGNALSGITVHGKKAAADFIMSSGLANCFRLHRTPEMPPNVSEYYSKTNPMTISVGDAFTWLEVGKGSPWANRPCIRPGKLTRH